MCGGTLETRAISEELDHDGLAQVYSRSSVRYVVLSRHGGLELWRSGEGGWRGVYL